MLITVAVFQQHSREVHILIKLQPQKPSSLLSALSVEKLKFMDTFLLFQSQTPRPLLEGPCIHSAWCSRGQAQHRPIRKCYWSTVSTSVRKWGSTLWTAESQIIYGPDLMAWGGFLIQQDLPDGLLPVPKLRAPACQYPPRPLGFQQVFHLTGK